MNRVDYVAVFVTRVHENKTQVLLGRRADGAYMGGTWQLISGGIEANERAWEAAIREVREETGLTVTELYRLENVAEFYRPDIDALCTGIYFLAEVETLASAQHNAEHTALEWVDDNDIDSRLTWTSDRTAWANACTQVIGRGRLKQWLRIQIA